uniref:Oligopeptide transporter n=1 Tax=Oryza rufipogon TaxID=4529 RepID=A0A0E0PSW4_ORYRU
MASSHHQEVQEQGHGDGEEEEQDNSQITSPLLRSSMRLGSPEENSPVEQVALTVPVGDDPATPVLTFRIWVLGTASCVVLSFLNTFFWYRKEPLTVTAISAQIAVVPLGRLMAAALPERVFFRGRPWEFTLNPGPFNVKEHVLITIFANAGAGSVFAINVITAVRVFYGKRISFFVSLLVVLTSQVLGFGWAGIFRRYLVEPAAMWWPSNLVQVSLFRALHEKERRSKGGMTRTQFFLVAFATYSRCSLPSPGFVGSFPNLCSHNSLDQVSMALALVQLDSTGHPSRHISEAHWLAHDGLFTVTGQKYNISTIIDSQFHFDTKAYEKNGPLYISTFFSISYGLGFACLTATVVHLPWWGVLLACALAIFFTLPIGIVTATTNQTPGLNIITEYIMGYLYPGRPVANMCFKVYGYIGPQQALAFLQDFKLGHYMKIPPRTMFMAQVVGTLIAAFVYLGTAWWLMDTIPNICNTELLPPGSPWTCPYDHLFYDASVIWGLIGPRRIFGDLGTYSAVNWFFLGGAIAPLLVWFAHKAFPGQKWILLVNMPVLIAGISQMPPATSVNYTAWIFVAFLSGYVVYKYRRDWWERHNYLLSGALDAGLAFMAVLLYLCLGLEKISLNWWGNDLDGCPLASCPIAEGVSSGKCIAKFLLIHSTAGNGISIILRRMQRSKNHAERL